MARDMPVIWVRGEGNYFWEGDWTGGITLKTLKKLARAKNSFGGHRLLLSGLSGVCAFPAPAKCASAALAGPRCPPRADAARPAVARAWSAQPVLRRSYQRSSLRAARIYDQ
jgi:hypothetical protein